MDQEEGPGEGANQEPKEAETPLEESQEDQKPENVDDKPE